ncbi:MAG: YfcE family phosphodiesterase [Promethearchaeota archaeon]
MKRVLVFGDTHVPTRRNSIPDNFHKHIEDTHYDLALITGDLVREKDMRAIFPPLPESYIVKGNMDYGKDHNFHEIVIVERFRILLIHGTQLRPRGNLEQLWEIANQVDADVAIHGHTHKPTIDLHKNRLLLNPGTASGATGGWSGRDDASFLELEVEGKNLTVILHNTDWNTTKTSRLAFCKDETDNMVRC